MTRDARDIVYDRIGHGYRAVRRTDPRLAEKIWSALGDSHTVLNAGAGTGSYEPRDCCVIAVEPSGVMIDQRPRQAAPVIRTTAEQLPLAEQTVDAAMAILTMHHWDDVEAGLIELRRITRRRIVLVTIDVEALAEMWLVRDYLPELVDASTRRFPTIARLCELLPGAHVETLKVPHDCRDGFMVAFWARPRAYLDPALRTATSPWYGLPTPVIDRALIKLREDLDSGVWEARYGYLLRLEEADVGLRIITAPVVGCGYGGN